MIQRFGAFAGLAVFLLVAVASVGCRDRPVALRIAVASNFAPTLETIVSRFERSVGGRIVVVSGSTGSQYAQIMNGAPFDLFLAADTLRPFSLEAEKRSLPGTRRTYALGRLALWMPGGARCRGPKWETTLDEPGKIAIANPDLAPYGRAARQVLERSGRWSELSNRVVRGENVAQAFQFVQTGNARVGLVAYSQLKRALPADSSSYCLVPKGLYDPIEQQLVLLKETPAARAFLNYLLTPDAKEILLNDGYGLR